MKRFLLFLWENWKRVARFIGKVNSYILLFIFYFIFIGITSLIIQLFRVDILKKRIIEGGDTFWIPKEWRDEDLERIKRQF